MKVIFGIGRVKGIRGAVAALGIFDGLHRGHLKILKAVVRRAKQIHAKSVVVTFNPHPQSEFNLYSLDHRINWLRKIGIDICVVIRFTHSFSRIPARAFIEKVLLKKLRPRCIFVGENFTFGRGGRGCPVLLKRYADRHHFSVKVIPIYKLKGRAVSSTYIRRLIADGDLFEAARLLGRPVSILGTVIKGSSLAQGLGFPTANIRAHHEVLPPAGVYLVKVNFPNRTFKGLCYLGSKPTLKKRMVRNLSALKGQRVHIEVHLLGFKGNLYGRDLEIQFIRKIREEKKFSGLKLLAAQIKKDIRRVKSRN